MKDWIGISLTSVICIAIFVTMIVLVCPKPPETKYGKSYYDIIEKSENEHKQN